MAMAGSYATQTRSFHERIEAWRDTRRRVEEDALTWGKIKPPPSIKHVFDPKRAPSAGTRVTVEDIDSIDCGLAYQALGFSPVVLNLADDCQPGGCVDIGSGAQEESLFRRTALYATLDQSMYPIGDDEGIYSPDVAVIKASEADGWAVYQQPKRMAFLTVPGVKYPRCVYADDKKPRLRPQDEARLRTKVRTMLQIASMHGHDAVVLGASGCGAWKCPPDHVAEIFRDVVDEYRGAFRVVAFAVKKNVDDLAPAKVAMGIEDNHTVFWRMNRLASDVPPMEPEDDERDVCFGCGDYVDDAKKHDCWGGC